MRAFAAVALLVLAQTNSRDDLHSTYMDGGSLHAALQGEHFSMGLGYVLGVFDALSVRESICLPKGQGKVVSGQLVAIVDKYLVAHPEDWHLTAAPEVQLALTEVFPCPKR